jgi:hypothetical protein
VTSYDGQPAIYDQLARISAATGDADEYEKRIREKLFNSGILTSGEWVYLVGLFHTAREHEDCRPCPRETEHTPSPSGYLAWHEWAEDMSKTHDQVKCQGCGLYSIWQPSSPLSRPQRVPQ